MNTEDIILNTFISNGQEIDTYNNLTQLLDIQTLNITDDINIIKDDIEDIKTDVVTMYILSVYYNQPTIHFKPFVEELSFPLTHATDEIGKISLRLLLPNDDPYTIQNILHELRYSYVTICVNGCTHHNIPNLLLQYVLSDHLEQPIRLYKPRDIDWLQSDYVENQYNSYTRQMVGKRKDDNLSVYNPETGVTNRDYVYNNIDDIYLIIPLSFDFLTYQYGFRIYSTTFTDMRLNIRCKPETVKYMNDKGITIGMFISEYKQYTTKERTTAIKDRISIPMISMSNIRYNKTLDTKLDIVLHKYTKLVYILLECTDDGDSTSLPEISEAVISGRTYHNLMTSNFYVCDYNRSRLYVISPVDQDVHDWVDMYKEVKKKGLNDHSINQEVTQFKCVEGYTDLYVYLTDYSIPVNIHIYISTQNMNIISGGMYGLHHLR